MGNHIGHRQRQVLVYLADNIPRSLNEISDHLDMWRSHLYPLLRSMISKGYIRYTQYRMLSRRRFQISLQGLEEVSVIGKKLIINRRGGGL